MNNQSRMRLYFLAAVACLVWLIYTVHGALQTGELFAWFNIVFYTCMLIGIGYMGYNGFALFKEKKNLPEQEADSEDAEDTADTADTEDAVSSVNSEGEGAAGVKDSGAEDSDTFDDNGK
jgi:threonine/homoserine/homoserine lactone efflux protein